MALTLVLRFTVVLDLLGISRERRTAGSLALVLVTWVLDNKIILLYIVGIFDIWYMAT